MISVVVKDENIVLIDKMFHSRVEVMEFLALLEEQYAGYEVIIDWEAGRE